MLSESARASDIARSEAKTLRAWRGQDFTHYSHQVARRTWSRSTFNEREHATAN